jgi:hypothetical protein
VPIDCKSISERNLSVLLDGRECGLE